MTGKRRAQRPEDSYGYVPPPVPPSTPPRRSIQFWLNRIGAVLFLVAALVLLFDRAQPWSPGVVAYAVGCAIAGIACWLAAPDMISEVRRPEPVPDPPPTALVIRGRIGFPFVFAVGGLAALQVGTVFFAVLVFAGLSDPGLQGFAVMGLGFATVITAFFGPIPVSMWLYARRTIWWVDGGGIGIGGEPSVIEWSRVRFVGYAALDEQGVVLAHAWTVDLFDGTHVVITCPAGTTPRPRTIRHTVERLRATGGDAGLR